MVWLSAGVSLAAMLVSLGLTWVVRRLARVHGWMAGPVSRRHVHTVPVPRLGGIAIFLSLAVVAGLLRVLGKSSEFLLISLIPAGWMFAVGLTDDLRGLRASRKLIAQLAAGIGLFALGVRVPIGDGVPAWAVSFTVTVLWTLTVTNATNLIDGLDGLASGSTMCALGAMLVAGLRFGQGETVLLAATLIGGVLGFLRFNKPPATIFLGDSGSLTLGVMLSAISIHLAQVSRLGWIVCALALAHPLAEVTLSTARRVLTANPVFKPDRRHLHHRLMDRGWSHRKSAAVLVGISFVFSIIAIVAVGGGTYTVVALMLAALAGGYAFRAFRYGEFGLSAQVRRKILDHRYTVDAHVQLREFAVAVERVQTLPELRRTLSEMFTALGFADAALTVDGIDRPGRTAPLHRGVDLDFPLAGRGVRIGALRLRWDLDCAMPIDLTLFAKEFLPALTRNVQWQLQLYRDVSPFALRQGGRRESGPKLVPALEMLKEREWSPLQN